MTTSIAVPKERMFSKLKELICALSLIILWVCCWCLPKALCISHYTTSRSRTPVCSLCSFWCGPNISLKRIFMFSRRKLRALGYQHWSTFELGDEVAFRTVVVFLEHEKIRYLAPEDRGSLQEIDSENWPNAFSSYLTGLECKWPYSGANCSLDEKASLFDWLLSEAICAEYSDHAVLSLSLSLNAVCVCVCVCEREMTTLVCMSIRCFCFQSDCGFFD